MQPFQEYVSVHGSVSLTSIVTSSTLVDLSVLYPDGFTVLSANLFDPSIASGRVTDLHCSTIINAVTSSSTRFENVMAIDCRDDLVINSNSNNTHVVYYNVTLLPSDISSTTPIRNILYGDFLLPLAIIIFLLSFVTWGVFWSPFKYKE